MAYQHVEIPAAGSRITLNKDLSLNVPDRPVIPFIEGDGIGVDITPVMRDVVDAAVRKAYGGRRSIVWMEIYAGEKCTRVYGKDTWLAKHRPAIPVVALDAIREALDIQATDNQGEVIQTAREQCREHLRVGQNFAFNGTNITRQMRKRWIDLFTDYGARIEIVCIEPPVTTILAQNKRRTAPVPEKVILRLLEKLEVPTVTECHSLTFA